MTTLQATHTYKRENPNALSPRLAGKLLVIILALMLVVGLVVATTNKAAAATMPRLDVMVKGENIRLGDVFQDLKQNADFVLAPAPAPGAELVWNEPTLLRIATAFDLPWRPEQGEEVRIRRAATLVDASTIKAVLRDHLASVDENSIFNVNITSQVPEIIVPGNDAPNLQLSDFNMLPTGGTFSAIVKVAGTQGHNDIINVRGVAERMVRLPVLKTSLKNGEVITADNLRWIVQRANVIRGDVVRDAETLIGSTPRRTLASGEVIRGDAIEMPRMVNRGDIITMVYKQNGMYLTVKGRALEDGAFGQSIKVSNTGSNRTLEARVSNLKEVTVN